MENIKKQYPYDDILLVYKCGSSAFGIVTDKSDLDYVVVLKEYKGFDHFQVNDNEYFVFGIKQWIAKMEFADNLPPYYTMFNDEILAFPESIVYLADEFKSTVDKYVNRDFKNVYKKWLCTNVEYFEDYLLRNICTKSLYHIFRVKNMIERYKKNGVFSHDMSNETRELINEYKSSDDFSKYKNKLLNDFNVIKQELKK